MIENITLLDLASRMARHATQRHQVIAQNVANADTPGYRARDVEEFQAFVKEAFTPRATRPGHQAPDPADPRPRMVELALNPAPNGNSVSVEDMALRAAEAQGQHALALAVYSKAIDILRIGLGRTR